MKRAYHIVKMNNKWQVRASASTRSQKNFNEMEDAIAFGREIAQRKETILYFFGELTGRIEKREDYRTAS